MSQKRKKRQKKIKGKTVKKGAPSRALNEGLTLYRSGKLKLALRKCQAVLADHPQHPDALNLGGIIYMDLGQTEASVKLLRSVVEILPESSQAHFNQRLNRVKLYSRGYHQGQSGKPLFRA